MLNFKRGLGVAAALIIASSQQIVGQVESTVISQLAGLTGATVAVELVSRDSPGDVHVPRIKALARQWLTSTGFPQSVADTLASTPALMIRVTILKVSAGMVSYQWAFLVTAALREPMLLRRNNVNTVASGWSTSSDLVVAERAEVRRAIESSVMQVLSQFSKEWRDANRQTQ